MARKKTTRQRSKPATGEDQVVEFISTGVAGGGFQVYLPPVWKQKQPRTQKRTRYARIRHRKQEEG